MYFGQTVRNLTFILTELLFHSGRLADLYFSRSTRVLKSTTVIQKTLLPRFSTFECSVVEVKFLQLSTVAEFSDGIYQECPARKAKIALEKCQLAGGNTAGLTHSPTFSRDPVAPLKVRFLS